MSPLIPLTFLAGLATLVCVAHGLRGRTGLAPLYMILGLLETCLFVAGYGEPSISLNLWFTDAQSAASIIFLPLILVAMVLIYVLEGTHEARRLLIALFALYLFHGVAEQALRVLAHNPAAGHAAATEHPLVMPPPWERLISLMALTFDGLTIVIVYQGLINRIPRLPLAVT